MGAWPFSIEPRTAKATSSWMERMICTTASAPNSRSAPAMSKTLQRKRKTGRPRRSVPRTPWTWCLATSRARHVQPAESSARQARSQDSMSESRRQSKDARNICAASSSRPSLARRKRSNVPGWRLKRLPWERQAGCVSQSRTASNNAWSAFSSRRLLVELAARRHSTGSQPSGALASTSASEQRRKSPAMRSIAAFACSKTSIAPMVSRLQLHSSASAAKSSSLRTSSRQSALQAWTPASSHASPMLLSSNTGLGAMAMERSRASSSASSLSQSARHISSLLPLRASSILLARTVRDCLVDRRACSPTVEMSSDGCGASTRCRSSKHSAPGAGQLRLRGGRAVGQGPALVARGPIDL
mmetsp:Transcript_84373/g.273167  ORF Transcript_84373/g.273167 Transcript_84373/m.273167 type:complete len:358 (+) Transcript_84373:834-1907(+)